MSEARQPAKKHEEPHTEEHRHPAVAETTVDPSLGHKPAAPVDPAAQEAEMEPPLLQLARILRTLRGSEEGIRLSAVPRDSHCLASFLESLHTAATTKGAKAVSWPPEPEKSESKSKPE
jgi:hypothetical protein